MSRRSRKAGRDSGKETLAEQLETLIKPNYPFIAGTTIAVQDHSECDRLATPNQRKTAAEVRRTIECIWALEPASEVRQTLARMYQTLQSPFKSVTINDRRVIPARLPLELLERVVGSVDLPLITANAEAKSHAAFGRLRLTARVIKDFAESQHPDVVNAAANAIFARLMADGLGGYKEFQLQLRAGSLLQAATHITQVGQVGEREEVLGRGVAGGTIAALVSACGSMTHFSLSNMGLDMDPELLVKLGKALNSCRHLRSLTLSGCHLNGGIVKPLGPLVRRGQLEELDLSGNRIDEGDPSWREWAGHRLTVLDISGTILYDMADLEALFTDTLQHLILVNCLDVLFEEDFTDDNHFHLRLELLPTLKSLDIRENHIHAPFLRMLKDHPLDTLLMSCGEGFDFSSLKLADNKSLSLLHVAGASGLSLSDIGLDQNRSLSTLYLGGIEPVSGLADFGTQLHRNHTLRRLSMVGCLDDASAALLSLAENTGLIGLDLSGCRHLTDVGLRAMGIDRNPTIKAIDLRQTRITAPKVTAQYIQELEASGPGRTVFWKNSDKRHFCVCDPDNPGHDHNH